MEVEIPAVVQRLIEIDIDKEIALLAYKQNGNSDDFDKLLDWIANFQSGKVEIKPEGELQQQPPQQQQQQQESAPPADQQQPAAGGEKKPEESQGQPLSDFVDQSMVAQVMSKGHSKFASEKAVFFTQEKGTLKAALDWIEEHSFDHDFEEQAFIVQQEAQEQKKMSKEEAKEWLRKRREQKAKEEEEMKKQSEVGRIQSTKQMTETRRQLEEAEQIRTLQQRKREKEMEAMERARMEEQLRRDKEERFGKKYTEKAQQQEQQKKVLTPVERFGVRIQQILTASVPEVFGDRGKICLQTIRIYLSNVIKEPNNDKFRKINQSNNAFKSRVEDCFGGVLALQEAGFKDDGNGFYVIDNADANYLADCVKALDEQIAKM